MMVNEKYRSPITRVLFRIENEAQEKSARRFVKYMKGPLYIAAGLGLLALGDAVLYDVASAYTTL
jgi:hypothetical protein